MCVCERERYRSSAVHLDELSRDAQRAGPARKWTYVKSGFVFVCKVHTCQLLRTNPVKEIPSLTTYWSRSTQSSRFFWQTGLAPWEFEFPFPGSLISTYLGIYVNFCRRIPKVNRCQILPMTPISALRVWSLGVGVEG